MKMKTFEDFTKIVNVNFLNKNIKNMITFNIPFPYSFIDLIKSNYLRNNVRDLYLYKTHNNQLFFNAFRHTGDYVSEDEDWYEVEFKILSDYVEKIPKFKELINI